MIKVEINVLTKRVSKILKDSKLFFIVHSLRLIKILALLIFIYTAIMSNGYFHEDEHYQIIGFAEYKGEKTNEVAWEYAKKMRPTLQPLITQGIFSLFRSLNIQNPFILSTALRLIMAVFSFFIIQRATVVFGSYLHKKYNVLFLITSYFLWFVPFLNVRFSAESCSGLCLLLSLTMILDQRKNPNLMWVGSLLGLSILFRYQSIICVVSIIGWLILVKKISFKHFFSLGIPCLLLMLIGIFADTIFYRQWSLSMLNYIYLNIFNSVSSYYGIEPWYKILFYCLAGPGYVLGGFIMASLFFYSATQPKNIFSWVILPYLAIHMLIPHKELRFLFPFVNLIPILLFLCLQEFESYIFQIPRFLKLLVFSSIVTFNSIGLLICINKSMRRGEIAVAEYIYSNFKQQKVVLNTSFESNPFDPKMNFKDNFYKAKNLKIVHVPSFWEFIARRRFDPNIINLLIISKSEITGPAMKKRLDAMSLVFCSVSDLEKALSDWIPFFIFQTADDYDYLLLYQVT